MERLNVDSFHGAQGHVTGSVIAPPFLLAVSIPNVGNGARLCSGAKIDTLADAQPLNGKDLAELVIKCSNALVPLIPV